MTTTCQTCGAPYEGGPYCGTCGQPFNQLDQPTTPPTPAAPTPAAPAPRAPAPQAPQPPQQVPPAAAPPQAPPPQAPASPQGGYPAPPAAPPPQPPMPPGAVPPPGGYGQPTPGGYPGMAAPARPKVNPFPGWPVSDYIRDAAAAFCLFAALGMPWDIGRRDWDSGADQWWVIIGVLLSVASLVLPYLHKAQLIPGWSSLHSKLAKLGANLPLLIGVIVALVNELVNVDELAGGLGTGIGMALAGVALAVQPRQAEEVGAGDDGAWNKIGYGFAIATVTVGVLLFVSGVISARDGIFDEILQFFMTLFVSLVLLLVMAAWPLAGYIQGSASWRRVFATSTFTAVVISLFALGGDGDGIFAGDALFMWAAGDKVYFEGFGLFFGGTFVLGAAAALSVARAQGRRTSEQTEPVAEWQKTASSALMLTAAASGVALLILVLGIVDDSDDLAAPIILSVLTVLIGVAAGVGVALAGNARKHRLVLLGILGGIVVLGFIVMGVGNSQDLTFLGTGWLVAAWVSLPALAASALTVPKDVRTAYGPLIQPQQPAQPGPFPPQPGHPGHFPPQPGQHGQPGHFPPQPGQHGQPGHFPPQPGQAGQPGQFPPQPGQPGRFSPQQEQSAPFPLEQEPVDQFTRLRPPRTSPQGEPPQGGDQQPPMQQ